MRKLLTKDWFGGGLLLTAIVLATMPWALGFANMTAPAVSAWVIAFALFMLFVGVAMELTDWGSAGALTIGAWSLIAPFVLGFHTQEPALWVHLAAGAASIALACAASDGRSRRPPERLA